MTLLINTLSDLFIRDLKKLIVEIESYEQESTVWLIDKQIKNSAGNLCLHIIGNLKTYIGNGFANADYERDREFEFAGKDVSRQILIQETNETILIIKQGLANIDDQNLDINFPILIWEKETNLVFTLIHLHSHLNYHLGQINYHRRLFDVRG